MNDQSQSASDPVPDIEAVKSRESAFNPYSGSHIDWRVTLGAIISVSWLAILGLYIGHSTGWTNIGDEPIERVGNFLEGAFAPLAFLWLVIGYFLQKKELMQNTDAIKMQYIEIQKSAAQAEIQSEAIKASELHARRESFLRIWESVREQLGATMGFLFLSSQGATGSGQVPEQVIASLWAKLGQDPDVFSRQMLELTFARPDRYAYKVLYGTETRTRHCENFIFNFERLLKTAEDFDDDGMIRDALLGSPNGYVYKQMLLYRDNPPQGFTYKTYDFEPDTMD